jgi:hypothetical protein
MKSSVLLPSRYKWYGLILLVPSLFLGILVRFYDFAFPFLTLHKMGTSLVQENHFNLEEQINLTDEFALTGIIIALLFIAFAREKQEDEFIGRLRLESLQWAVIFNYILLLVATWLVHGLGYIDVMMYNMLTILLFFIIRFHLVLYRNRSTINE